MLAEIGLLTFFVDLPDAITATSNCSRATRRARRWLSAEPASECSRPARPGRSEFRSASKRRDSRRCSAATACSRPPAPTVPSARPRLARPATRRGASSPNIASLTAGWVAGRRYTQPKTAAPERATRVLRPASVPAEISTAIGKSSSAWTSIASASSSAAPLAG